jgi:hypothetical protein
LQGFVAHLRHGIAWILFKLGEPWSKARASKSKLGICKFRSNMKKI